MDRRRPQARKSRRRSAIRERVHDALTDLRVAYAAELAAAAKTDVRGVIYAMYGRPKHYRYALSLVPLGIARELRSPNGRLFEITPFGLGTAPRRP